MTSTDAEYLENVLQSLGIGVFGAQTNPRPKGPKYNVQRDDFTSATYREGGNNLYRMGKYYHAIKSYTQAYVGAEDGSRDMGLALANRSAVLLSAGFYKESISDSKLALANNYPENLHYKVHQRLATCYVMLGQKKLAAEHYAECCKLINEKLPKVKVKSALASAHSDYTNGVKPKCKKIGMTYGKVPQVSYGVHRDMPGVSSALELKQCLKYGPHFVARKPIKTGDVLFIEDPIVFNLVEKKDQTSIDNHEMESCFTYCFHCFKQCLNMHPCSNCKVALFCSKKCFNSAWGSYHKLECDARHKYTTERSPTDFSSNSIMVTICCKMISMFGVEKCIRAVSNVESAPPTLKAMLQLPLAVYPVAIVEKTRALAKKIAICCFGVSGTKQLHLTEFLVMAMMIFKRNAVKISHPQYHAETDILINHYSIGWGLFLHTTSVLHNCMPNTYGAYYEGKTCVSFATMPIKPGEMITANWLSGIPLADPSAATRKAQIELMFNFNCECEACVKGFQAGDFLNDAIIKKYPELFDLYIQVVPLITNHVCYNLDPSVPLNSKVLNLCLQLQDAFIKAGVPMMDHIFDGVQRILHNNMLLKAVKFNLDGTGLPYLFASEKDVAADLKKKKEAEEEN